MPKLVGRQPIEIRISSPQQDHIPYFNQTTRLWETRDINEFITGSNTYIGTQIISGSLVVSGSSVFIGNQIFSGSIVVTGSVSAENLQNLISSSDQVTASLDLRYVLSSSFNTFSSSVDLRLDDLELFSSSLDTNFVTEQELSDATSSLISIISTKLDTGSYLIDSASFDNRIDDLETFSSSLDTTFVNQTELADATGSLINSIATKLDTGSYLIDSASFDNRIDDLELFSSSLDENFVLQTELTVITSSIIETITTLVDTASYGADSASFDNRLDNLEIFTASIDTTIKTKLDTEGVISGSIQILGGSGILSSSDTNFTTFSSSVDVRLDSLESFSSSLDDTFVNQTELADATGSLINSIDTKLDTGSYLTDSASFDTRIDGISSTTGSYLLNITDTLDGDLTVTGIITAQEFHTEFVSASIIYQSGSTKFGDSSDDTHEFTGSIQQSGSNSYFLGDVGIGTTTPTTKLQVTGYISGSDTYINDWGSVSASLDSVDSRVDNLETFSSSLDDIFVNQIELADTTGSLINLIATKLDTGSYLTDSASFDSRIDQVEAAAGADWNTNLVNIPNGLVSGSSQILDGSGILSSSDTDFTTFSSSVDTRIDNLESFSSSLDTTFVNETELADATGSLINSIATKLDTGSYLIDSASFDLRIDDLEVFSSSIDTTYVTQLELADATGALEDYNTIQDARLDSIESFTSSIDTTIKTKLDTEGVISGSIQILGGSGILSSSTQNFTEFSSSVKSYIIELLDIDSNHANRLSNLETFSSSLDATFVNQTELADATGSLINSIDTKLDTGSYLVDSASFDTRIDDLETFSSSLDDTFVNQTELADATGSLINSIATKLDTGSYLIDSASFDLRIDDLEIFSSSLDTTFVTQTELADATGSLINSIATKLDSGSYLTDSASFDTRIDGLETFSSSIDTTIKTKLDTEGVISGSEQLTTEFDIRYLNTGGDNVVSGSSQIILQDTTGDLSGSRIDGLVDSASQAISASHSEEADTITGYVWPATDGLEAQFLQTDGAGNLIWEDTHTVYEHVIAGENLVKTDPVYLSGSSGATPIAYKADASNPAKMPAIYVVNENISQGSEGRVIAVGLIEGIDLTGFTAGQLAYVGVGGGWTTTRPTGNVDIQVLGIVTKGGNGGKGFVFNQGRQRLPNLETGKLWLGDSNWYPQAVSPTNLGLALTGSSNTFTGTQTFGDIVVNGTGSFTYIESVTGTSTSIGESFIVLNNNTPAQRYAGLVVVDSGSALTTASLQFDGQLNDWFYEYSTDGGVTTDHAIVLFGPEYSSIGSPTYIPANSLVKSEGNHHLTSSSISDNGTLITLGSNTTVTGTLSATTFLGLISQSAQVDYTLLNNLPSGILSSSNTDFTTFSSSVDGRLDTLETQPNESPLTFNSSTTIQFNRVGDVVSADAIGNIVSGSQQVVDLLPSGVVSGSSQITITESQISDLTHYTDTDNLTYLNSLGVVSGSSQVSFNGILDKPTLVSGSSQIVYSDLSNIPSGIVSGSSQILDGSGILSSSDTNFTDFSSSVDGRLDDLESFSSSLDVTYVTQTELADAIDILEDYNTTQDYRLSSIENFTSSIDTTIKTKLDLEGVISGSDQLTGSYDSRYILSGSITDTTWENIEGKPSGLVSGSSQIDYNSIQNQPTIGTGSLTVSGSSGLQGNGIFYANQNVDTSIVIEHLGVTTTQNTSNVSPSNGGTFTAVDSLTFDAFGHTTQYNVKTITLPTYTQGSGIALSGNEFSIDLTELILNNGLSAANETTLGINLTTLLGGSNVVSGSSQVTDILTSLNSYTQSNDVDITDLFWTASNHEGRIDILELSQSLFDTAVTLNNTDVTILGSLDVTNNITGSLISLNDGYGGVYIGEQAGISTLDLNENVGIGYQSLKSNTYGYSNVAVGAYTLLSNQTSTDNTAIGMSVLRSNTDGSGNTGVGSNSLRNNTIGGYNSAIGRSSLFSNTTGASNISLGYATLYSNTIGSYNIGIGNNSLYNNRVGDRNIGIGYAAGSTISNGTTPNYSGSYSIFLGDSTKANADNETNQIVIGYNVIGNGSNTVTIGNQNITHNYFNGIISGSSIEAVSITGSIAATNGVISGSSQILDGSGILSSSDSDFTTFSGSVDERISLIEAGGLTALIQDTTPQLGGNLDINSNNISGSGNINIDGTVTATSFTGDGSSLTFGGTNIVSGSEQLIASLDLRYLEIGGDNVVSSSQQIDVNDTQNFSTFSGSVDSRLDSIETAGYVDVSGTPSSNNIAVFDDANTIRNGGVNSPFTYDTGTLSISSLFGPSSFNITGNSPSINLSYNGLGSGTGTISTTSDTALYVKTSGTGNLQLGTNNTPRLTIENDGDVGIGTTSPTAKLHVNGNISGSDIYINQWGSVSASLAAVSDGVEAIPLTNSESGTVAGTSFTFVSPEQVYDVTFSNTFESTNYSVNISSNARRIFTVENKTTSGFRINSNSKLLFLEDVTWTAILN